MKNIYLIRHCQATGQEAEAELTEVGQEQALQLADYLAAVPVEYIISSPFTRAVKTIKPYAEKNSLSVQEEERLSERVLSHENLTDWLTALEQSFIDVDLRFGQGETSREAQSRGMAVLKELWDSPYENIVLVTHGNLLALLLQHFEPSFGFKEWQRLSNPDVYQLSFEDNMDQAEVKRIWQA